METKKETKIVKTAEAVDVYNVLKGLHIGKLGKEEQFGVLRAAKALKPVASGFSDFLADVRERLKPEGFDEALAKAREQGASEQDRAEASALLDKYNRDVEECVRPELEKEQEIESLSPLGEEAIGAIATANEQLDVQALMLIEDVCG